MADQFGGISLPVALSGATLADTDLGKADPTGHKLLGFCAAVLRAQGATEWAALRPRPAGDTEGVSPVRKAFLRDPKKGQLDDAKDLPALFVWRRLGRQEQATDDFRHETATFSALWLMPPDDPKKEALREPFMNAAMKALGAAIRQGRHPAWADAGDPDPRAATRLADDDAIVLPFATSTSPVNLSGVGLDGVIGGTATNPRLGLTITTSAAAGAYNPDVPVIITYVDWRDVTREAAVYLEEDGGQVANPSFEAKQVVSVALPAQQLTTGSIRVGVVARQGKGSSLLDRASLMRADFTEWAPIDVPIDIMGSDNKVVDTVKYYGALATITCVEQLVRDPAANAWPIAVPPAGLDLDVSIDGEDVGRAEL